MQIQNLLIGIVFKILDLSFDSLNLFAELFAPLRERLDAGFGLL
jgi:hypothetical protein